MRVRTFDHEAFPKTIDELRNTLSIRMEGASSYWLGDNDGPSLAVLVKDANACVHYFPGLGHPGFHSVGPNTDWEDKVSFVADNYEATEVPIAMVVPWSSALLAAEEFFQSVSKPNSLAWKEL